MPRTERHTSNMVWPMPRIELHALVAPHPQGMPVLPYVYCFYLYIHSYDSLIYKLGMVRG